jgi:hypothetical protein
MTRRSNADRPICHDGRSRKGRWKCGGADGAVADGVGERASEDRDRRWWHRWHGPGRCRPEGRGRVQSAPASRELGVGISVPPHGVREMASESGTSPWDWRPGSAGPRSPSPGNPSMNVVACSASFIARSARPSRPPRRSNTSRRGAGRAARGWCSPRPSGRRARSTWSWQRRQPR